MHESSVSDPLGTSWLCAQQFDLSLFVLDQPTFSLLHKTAGTVDLVSDNRDGGVRFSLEVPRSNL
jgi:hypothetical protein